MNDITLLKILNYYDEVLCAKIYKYVLNKKTTITLVFYKEQLCHLLGLQHVYDNSKHYLGSRGYEKIKNGDVTLEHIKSHNEKQYHYLIPKFENFCRMEELLQTGTYVRFDCFKCKPNSRIGADFLIYKDDENSMLLHLFLKRERNDSDIFAPMSFIVKLPGDKDYKQFIEGQEYRQITGFEIISK